MLRIYERASGQKVNYDKTQISFSKNLPSTLMSEITNLLGVVEVDHQEKIFGYRPLLANQRRRSFRASKRGYGKSSKGGRKIFCLVQVKKF